MAKQLELELVVTWGPGSHLLVRTPAVGEAGGPESGRGPGLRRWLWAPCWASSRGALTALPARPQVLVEKRHMGKLCGLCGDFNGKQTDEFLSEEGRWGPGPEPPRPRPLC